MDAMLEAGLAAAKGVIAYAVESPIKVGGRSEEIYRNRLQSIKYYDSLMAWFSGSRANVASAASTHHCYWLFELWN